MTLVKIMLQSRTVAELVLEAQDLETLCTRFDENGPPEWPALLAVEGGTDAVSKLLSLNRRYITWVAEATAAECRNAERALLSDLEMRVREASGGGEQGREMARVLARHTAELRDAVSRATKSPSDEAK